MTALETELLEVVESVDPDRMQAWLLARDPDDLKRLEPFVREQSRQAFARAKNALATILRPMRNKTARIKAMKENEDRATREDWSTPPADPDWGDYLQAKEDCPKLHKRGGVWSLAVFATGRWSAIRALDHEWWVSGGYGDRVFAILQKVRPSWLQQWPDHLLDLRAMSNFMGENELIPSAGSS